MRAPKTYTEDLAGILSHMFHSAPPGDKVAMIHLFGIQYADKIGSRVTKIVDLAEGVPNSYITEVYKGMRLAKYVTVKR